MGGDRRIAGGLGRLSGALVLGLLAPGTARAESWHVPGDSDTIAGVLAYAAPWDSIAVDAATYGGEGPVTVTVDIYVYSADGTPVAYPAFAVVDASLRLEGGSVDGWSTVRGDTFDGLGIEERTGILVLNGDFEGTGVTLDGGGGYGILAIDSRVRLADSVVEGFDARYALKSVSWRRDSYLILDASTIRRNTAGAVYTFDEAPAAHYQSLSVTGSTFEDNASSDEGGDLYLYNVDAAEIRDTTFSRASAAVAGGSILAYDTHATLEDVTFAENSAPSGGSIYALDTSSTHTLLLTRVGFASGRATEPLAGAGGDIAAAGYAIDATDLTSVDASAVYGGALYLAGGTFHASGADVRGADAEVGGALFLDAVSEAAVTGANLCGNTAADGGALYALDTYTVLDTSAVVANTSAGGGAVQIRGGSASVTDVSFVANDGARGAVDANAATLEIVNDLFVGGLTGVTGEDVVTSAAGHNLYWQLDQPDAGYTTFGADVHADPLLAPEFDAADCATAPLLQAGSPAEGAGDPARADRDIGAFPVAPGGGGPDNDGDGVSDGEDCGADDPAVFPGAWDDPLDDIDQDCDGAAATATARGGCACGTSGAPAGLGLALVALVAVGRRRGSPA